MQQGSEQMASGGRPYWSAIDYLKTAAIIAVVFTHAGPRWYDSSLDRLLRTVWVSYHIPVFLLISGFLYWRPREIAVGEVGRRLVRVLVPYAIASCLVWILGVNTATDFGNMLFRLVTGSALGIYYYVFLIALFIPLLWPLSRMQRWALLAVLVCAYAYPMAAKIRPELELASQLFWRTRNPLYYFLAFFLTGWVAAAFLPTLEEIRRRAEPLLWAAAIGGVAVWFAVRGFHVAIPTLGAERAIYCCSVVLIGVLLTSGRRVPRVVRFLSEASFTIYLYHVFFIAPLRPYMGGWNPLLRAPLLVALAVLGSAVIVLVGRRILGTRSRLLIGC